MGKLEHIIQELNKEEARNLKLFLNRTSSSGDRLDVQLFDLIRKKGENIDDQLILSTLYDDKEKNKLYRLKNRLMNDINKSLTSQYFNTQESNTIMYFIALSRLFNSKGRVNLVYAYLRKAEVKATKTNDIQLLDVIYSDFIRLSQESASINPISYIEKRKENAKHLKMLRDIDDVLAVLMYKIKVSQNYAVKDEGILNLLNKTIKEFGTTEELEANPTLQLKVYQAISRALLREQDFTTLEQYLLDTLENFEQKKLFDKRTHDTKLQILTYLANSQFTNGKREAALKTNRSLFEEMQAFNGLLFDKYLIYYYNSQVNMLADSQPDQAIQLLESAILEEAIVSDRVNFAYILTNLVLLYFKQEEFKKASKFLVQIKIQESFNILDMSYKLKLAVCEILTRFELEDFDYLEQLIVAFNKGFEDLTQKDIHHRDKIIIQLVSKMIYSDFDPKIGQNIKLITSLLEDPQEAQKHDLINYNTWIKKKLSLSPDNP